MLTVILEQLENVTNARVSANRRFHFFQLTWPDTKFLGVMLPQSKGINKAESRGVFASSIRQPASPRRNQRALTGDVRASSNTATLAPRN